MPLYRDVMTLADRTSRRVGAAVSALWSGPAWRATGNALAALLIAVVGGILLGGLVLIWGAAVVSLVHWPVGGWAHAVLYVAVVVAGPVLALWAVPWLTAATWRQLAFHLLALVTGVIGGGLVAACWLAPVVAIGYLAAGHPPAAAGAVAVAAAAGLLLAAPWLARQVTRADAASARALLGPSRSEELAQRVESLARSRADIVAATDAERRRIERDLHDGAQQRLVSLAMNLGMARERFAGAPEPVRRTIADAHDEAVLALSELREFIRGLHPAVLNDRGLDAALSGLAARAPLPVRLRVDVPRPASPSVEAVAYFIVSEALTNVAKHARATQAEVA